jgi:hypothetical protein
MGRLIERSERNILLASMSTSIDLGDIHPVTVFEIESAPSHDLFI